MNVYVIPDTQQKEGVKNPLIAIARHIAETKPDVVIHLGDHWDFPSLSQYDKGKKSHRSKTYLKDIKSGNNSMAEFWAEIRFYWPRHKSKCRFIILQGNHEFRRNRALEYGPDELVSLIEEFPMNYDNWDRVFPFLKIVKINGVAFSHYFQNKNTGRALSSARKLLIDKHVSCIAGHKQGFEYSEDITDNKQIQAMIIGSCYYHDESYKAQSNHHWRGTVLLKNVKNGMFDFERFNINNLDERYIF